MGYWKMKKMRIGYWPISTSMKSAGDRRRLLFWAQIRGHEVVTDLSQKVDVIVASEMADFNSIVLRKSRAPLIFDLVDAYLSPRNPYEDFARGVAKSATGQISGKIRPFSHHVSDFCVTSKAVICSSIEQRALIQPYNLNTHIILDSHEEIPFVEFGNPLGRHGNRILWEGQPATIGGIGLISTAIAKLAQTNNLPMSFVTDEMYFEIMNKFIRRSTVALLKNHLGTLANYAKVIPWSPSNLVSSAMLSNIAIIPIDTSVPIQRLKPENRLLIMWRLGLPCLTSDSPAYVRVSTEVETITVCRNLDEWYQNALRLLSDPDLARIQVTKGQDYLRQTHSKDSLLKKWDLAFDSVMG